MIEASSVKRVSEFVEASFKFRVLKLLFGLGMILLRSIVRFSMLASNYLRITEHRLFTKVQKILLAAKATPAEVGEQLLKTEDPETTIRQLLEFLQVKEEKNSLIGISQEKESNEGEIVEVQ